MEELIINKKEFNKYILELSNNFSITEKIALLNKIALQWIPEIKSTMLKNYSQCSFCLKYFLKKDTVFHRKVEKQMETTHIDSGYGYDDEMGEVEYYNKYLECPICHKQKRVDSLYLRTLWSKKRRE